MTQFDAEADGEQTLTGVAYPKVPSACPCCGAFSLAPQHQVTTLLTVSDVLVFKALEAMGKFIVRAERSRFKKLGAQPFYIAHTLWQAEDHTVDKALKNAWDVVPHILDVHGCCDVTPVQVTSVLDDYVHDLVVTGTPHTIEELAFRFESKLGLPVRHGRLHEDHRHDEAGAV